MDRLQDYPQHGTEDAMTDNRGSGHNKTSEAVWTEGLREIFEYRGLGIKAAIKGDYSAHKAYPLDAGLTTFCVGRC